jgi:hypothetical protein
LFTRLLAAPLGLTEIAPRFYGEGCIERLGAAMGTVKVYNYKRRYDIEDDALAYSRRMAVRKYIKRIGGTVIEETELEVDSSKVDEDGKTKIDFFG